MSESRPRRHLCLYVAGTGDLATRARTNLERILADHVDAGDFTLEVVDVLETPFRAIEDQVILTPLLRVVGRGGASLVGDLSDAARVLAALGRDD